MTDSIFHIVLYGLISLITIYLFFKERKIYYLLFAIFFIIELLRVIFLEKYLTSTLSIVTNIVEGFNFITAVVLFVKSKYKLANN